LERTKGETDVEKKHCSSTFVDGYFVKGGIATDDEWAVRRDAITSDPEFVRELEETKRDGDAVPSRFVDGFFVKGMPGTESQRETWRIVDDELFVKELKRTRLEESNSDAIPSQFVDGFFVKGVPGTQKEKETWKIVDDESFVEELKRTRLELD